MTISATLTPMQSRIVEAISRRPMSCRELASELYCHRDDGGPEWAETAVKVQIHHIRKRGVPVLSGRSTGYYVLPVEFPSSGG